jgi:hypothetical protein
VPAASRTVRARPWVDALDVFGIFDTACRGDTPSAKASLMPWRDLPTHLRQSNNAQVGRRANLWSESRKKEIDTVEHLPALLAGADLYLRRLPATEH